MRTTGDWSFGDEKPKLKPGVRGMAEFGQQHFEWMRKMQERDITCVPDAVTVSCPIEMTQEEHDALTFGRFALGKMSTLFGHKVKISAEPVGTIPLPSRV